jgi:Nucleotidyl transferase AbiEii toxin, Type IV TA system
VGDPIWPAPADIALPRLLEAAPIPLRGYPREMVLAEKIVTVLQRGQANTRWRDFGDIYQLTRRYAFRASDIERALQTVAEFRGVELSGLDEILDGYAEIGQPRWAPWRAKLQLAEILPADFRDALEVLRAFADPVLAGVAAGSATWNPELRMWEHADSDR